MLKNVSRDEVLEHIKKIGPTIPARIVKALGGDTFLIGAVLSDLANNNHIKITSIKIGGSPFYYIPGQESQLSSLSQYLNEKDKRTFSLLQQERILKDETQDPLVKVSLRQLKDFAKPIEVILNKEKVLFWKYFLVTNKEVETIIREKYVPKPPPKPAPIPEPKEEVKTEEKKPPEPVKQEKKEEPKETKKETTAQKKLAEEDKKTWTPERGDFSGRIQSFFTKKDITILEHEKIRKTEYDFVLSIPSSIGEVQYFCKVKDKKRCNDGDLASAFVKGQSKKLPTLFITTGQVTKKAKEMLEKEFKGLKIIEM